MGQRGMLLVFSGLGLSCFRVAGNSGGAFPFTSDDHAVSKRRFKGKYALSTEASFTGTSERIGISGWINQSGRYIFTTSWE